MKEIILDANFIMTAVKNKVDFFYDLKFEGYKILIPQEIIMEIENVLSSRQKLHNRNTAKIALEILENSDFEKINLKSKKVDEGIIKYAEETNSAIATLDRDLKRKFKGKILTIKGRKKIEEV